MLEMLLQLEGVPVIQMGVVVLVSLFMGAVFTRLGLSSAVGYVVAGLLLGPLGSNYLTGLGTGITAFLGELGITMLLFYLGLELSLKRFKESGAVASILAFVEMLLPFVGGTLIAYAFGFDFVSSIIIGAMLTATSTVITSRFILEKNLIGTPEARVVLSILVLEDFFAILVLVFLSSIATQQSLNLLVFNAVMFVIAMFFIVRVVSKQVLNLLTALGYGDHAWLYGIGVFMVVAYFGSNFLGLSPALGAYFAGFALAETKYGDRIKHGLGLFREFFILFFFVSFGAATPLPNIGLFPLLAAILVIYVISKFLAYGVFGVALGLEAKSAVIGGLLMVSVGEFSLIIADQASKFLPRAADLRVMGFLLMVSTTILMPLLYNRKDAATALWERVYPKEFRERSRVLQRSLGALNQLLEDKVFQNEFFVSAKRLFTNMVIAVSIVYLSYLTNAGVSIPFVPLPGKVSLSLLILPLIFYPVYKFIEELRLITKKVAGALISRSFPTSDETVQEVERQAASVFTGLVLSAIGMLATLAIYSRVSTEPLVLLIPIAYTVLALTHLSRSFYALVEEYGAAEEELEEVEAGLLGKNRKVYRMSKEFEEHSKYLKDLGRERDDAQERLVEAAREKKVSAAKNVLQDYKKKETKALVNLFDFRALKHYPRLRTLFESKEHVERQEKRKQAFQQYLKRKLSVDEFEEAEKEEERTLKKRKKRK